MSVQNAMRRSLAKNIRHRVAMDSSHIVKRNRERERRLKREIKEKKE